MNMPMITEFRVGRTIARTLSIAARKAVPFGMATLAILSPVYLYAIFVDPVGYAEQSVQTVDGLLVLGFETLLGWIAGAVVCHATIRELRGGSSSLWESARWSLGVMPTVVGVAFLSLLGVAAGLVLFIVPGLILMIVWWVVIPVAVIENTGIRESFARSLQLTRGNRWRLFGLFLIYSVTVTCASIPLMFLFADDQYAIVRPVGYAMASYACSVIFTALYAVLMSVCYHDLRILQEGDDDARIAAIFD